MRIAKSDRPAVKPTISVGNSGISAANLRMFNSVSAQRDGGGKAKPNGDGANELTARSADAEAQNGRRRKAPRKEPIPEVDMTKVRLPQVEAFNPFRVRPMEHQIRQQFFGIGALARSIEAVGQLVPVIAVKISGDPDFDAQLVDGEGRLKACMKLKRGIAAFLWDGDTDIETLYEASVAANCNRHDHNPVERLAAVVRMKNHGRTDEHIASVFGKSIGWVGQQYMLRRLHKTVLNWMIPNVKDGEDGDTDSLRSGSGRIKAPLNFQLGLLLSKITPAEAQIPHAREIIQKNMSLAQAQHYIAGALRGVQGVRSGGGRRAVERMAALASQARSVEFKFRTYTDMPVSDIQSLLCKLDGSHIQSLDDSLARLTGTVTSLRELIRQSLPRGVKLDSIIG